MTIPLLALNWAQIILGDNDALSDVVTVASLLGLLLILLVSMAVEANGSRRSIR